MSELSGERVRLDRWLWAARFFKTRGLAAAAIAAGRVEVNGARAKRAKLVAAGDQLRVRRGPFEYRVVVRGVSERRGPPAQAAALFAEDAEGRRLRERLAEQPPVAPSLRYEDRKSTRLNSSHSQISYAVFCLKKKKKNDTRCMPRPATTLIVA